MKNKTEYFEQARSWAADSQLAGQRQLRFAWILAAVIGLIAVLEAVALMMLTPLKTVQPVTLLVDRQTGYVQALNPLEPQRIGADAALTQSLLAQYVNAREGFDRGTIRTDYRRVALWSSGVARSQYLSQMPSENSKSPFHTVPSGWSVAVHVKSVSPLAAGLAMVRFDTIRQDRTGRMERADPWVAVVRYAYSDAPMSFEDRLLNPLGFQVSSYRRDAEAPSVDPTTATAPAAAAAPIVQPTVPVLVTPSRIDLRRPTQAFAPPPPYSSPPARLLSPGAQDRPIIRLVPSTHVPLGNPIAPPRDETDERPEVQPREDPR